jgi:hypothetical protein
MSPDITYSLDHQLNLWFDIDLRCLPQYAQEAGDLISEISREARITDTKILKQLIIESRSGYESAITSNGRRFVLPQISASLSPDGYLASLMSGIGQFELLRGIDTEDSNQLAYIISIFEKLRQIIFVNKNIKLNITTNDASKQKAEYIASHIIKQLPHYSQLPAGIEASIDNQQSLWGYTPDWTNQAYSVPGQINFVGIGIKLQGSGYQSNGVMKVVNNYLRMGYLWENIRLIGGAYGSSNSYDAISDVYAMCSFRDPNITSSINTYIATGQHLSKLEMNQDELDKNIIGTIGGYDSHLLPHQKGAVSFSRYIHGITDQYRQTQRDQILSTTLDDFRTLGQYFEKASQQYLIKAIGNHDQLTKELQSKGVEITQLLK